MSITYTRTWFRNDTTKDWHLNNTTLPEVVSYINTLNSLVATGNVSYTDSVSTDSLSFTRTFQCADLNAVAELETLNTQDFVSGYAAHWGNLFTQLKFSTRSLSNVPSGFTVTVNYSFATTVDMTTLVQRLQTDKHLANLTHNSTSITAVYNYTNDADYNSEPYLVFLPNITFGPHTKTITFK